MQAKNANTLLEMQKQIQETFESLVEQFVVNIDFYFRNYNKNLKENIEMQIKASKKEKLKYLQFLTVEERLYWKDFPRKQQFYKEGLRQFYNIHLDITRKTPQIKDIPIIITTILNILPQASQKYCKKFGIEQIFQQDLMNKLTFDQVIENLKMFDADDHKNWKILASTIAIMAADSIQILLQQAIVRDIQVNNNVIDSLLEICRFYQLPYYSVEIDCEEESILEKYYKQIQMQWSKIFTSISQLNFQKSMKFMMRSLQQDFRKLRDDEITQHGHRIFFCRFISIVPSDKLMASHVQTLIESFKNILTSKGIKEELKVQLYSTLKYMIEQLYFYYPQYMVMSGQISEEFNFDSPLGILWPSVESLFKIAEKATKKEGLRDQAIEIMILIIKVSPQAYFNENMSKFLKTFKLMKYFENKKSYNVGLQLISEMSSGGKVIFSKDQIQGEPKLFTMRCLYQNNQNTVTPLTFQYRQEGYKLCRKFLPTEQMPISFREMFKTIFNCRLFQRCNYFHEQYLIQMAFEDLDYLCSFGIQMLMGNVKSQIQERLDLILLGLKVSHYLLKPNSTFRYQYMQMYQYQNDLKKLLDDKLEFLKQFISYAIKEMLKSQIFKSDFIADMIHYFKSEDKELCNDQMSIVWNELFIVKAGLGAEERLISQKLIQKNIGTMYLAEEKRQISFEDFRELQSNYQKGNDMDNEFKDEQVSQVFRSLEKEHKEWDKKKEKFMRHRLICYLSEERKEGQRQNTSLYQYNTQIPNKKDERKIIIRILKMIYYLPEVVQYLKHYPLNKLLVQDRGLLLNKVPEINGGDKEEKGQQQQNQGFWQGEVDLMAGLEIMIPIKKKKSFASFHSKHNHPKLKECQYLLPYFLISLCPEMSKQSSNSIMKLIRYGDTDTKMSFIDQILYFLKELMLDTPEDFLICQYLQQLISIIRLWHSLEKAKIKIDPIVLMQNQNMLDEYQLLKDISDNSQLNNKENMLNEKGLDQYQYIFEMIDVISMMGLCNKEKMIRQLAVVLMVEVGKFKRLTISKDKYQVSLYDIFYYQKESIKDSISKKIVLFNPFKQQEFKTLDEVQQILADVSLLNIIIDNFDYKKAGLNETLVRDISVLLIGEVVTRWKQQSIKSSQLSLAYINFLSILSSRTLTLFENKGEGLQITKDYVGINLLLAITIFNCCRSHLNQQNSQGNNSDEYHSSDPHQIVSSSNSILEELSNLLTLLELDFSDIYKTAFGKFYPQRFSISSIILSFLYSLQDPYDQRSLDNIKEIFQIERSQQNNNQSYLNNCLIFYTLLIMDSNSTIVEYMEKDRRVLKEFIEKLDYFQFTQELRSNEVARKQRVILFLNYLHSVVVSLKKIVKGGGKVKKMSEEQKEEVRGYLKSSYQLQLLEFVKVEYYSIEENPQLKKELGWIIPKISEICQTLTSFETIFSDIPNVKLDLKFLISLESKGYQVLKYYKYLQNTNIQNINKSQLQNQEDFQQEFNINELKELLNQIFAFYSQKQTQSDQLMRKNTYYNCLINNIIGIDDVFVSLKNKNFEKVYQQLISSCLRSNKISIESKIKKFISYNLQAKYFLLGLFMSLNSIDKKVIERSKVLALSVLPLMFEESVFREKIESEIVLNEDLRNLISFENKNFYRFVKQAFKDEESFNMKNHFEKYFSISGLLRNTLNEIIKIQQIGDFSQRMLIKVLDIITYFIANLQLRRAPLIDSNAFIFDNMIDYKSFEFLSKLYKITEKLIDFDDESIIMNMWYKLVEGGKVQNFEILAKFLVHNLSAYLVKVKESQKDKKYGKDDKSEYSLEYEKQKRYSMSIFNYIKARTLQMDVRNSINLSANSITWSQKMIKILRKAALNIQSKTVLEKLKLKKILQFLHSEVNEAGIQLMLKGGIEQNIEIMNQHGKRLSVNMSQLLQSTTFLNAFQAKNKKENSIMKNVLFRVRKIMTEQFNFQATEIQLEQLPLLIMKYFENSLAFITNDSERPTQILKFSQKESHTVTIVIIVLIIDIITTQEKNENRFYFLLEIFNKLSINISQIQKYFYFKMLTIDFVYSKETKVLDKLQQIINLSPTLDTFEIFSKVLFKMLLNFTRSSEVQYYLLKLWLSAFQKHKEYLGYNAQSPTIQQHQMTSMADITIIKNQMNALRYDRRLILQILQSAYFKVYEMSQMKREVTNSELKYYAYVFKQHFLCISEYVIQPQYQSASSSISSFTSHIQGELTDSMNVAFGTNAFFWFSFISMEAYYLSKHTLQNEQKHHFQEFQALGMNYLRRIMEESDFVKMLIGIFKLSQKFFQYSLSLSKRQVTLMDLLFDCLENPQAAEDAIKCLIISIRVQDLELLNNEEKKQISQIELQRFILLIPYFLQQFLATFKGIQQDNKMSNYRNTVQVQSKYINLLKKSLSSIGIDKKKDVYDRLESLQKESEKNDEKLLKNEFEQLMKAAIDCCFEVGHIQVIFDSLKILISMKQCKSLSGSILEQQIKIMSDYIKFNDLQEDEPSLPDKYSAILEQVYPSDQELLGEQTSSVKLEYRPLYFGIKNIILKEIENIDKEIEVSRFFIDPRSSKDSAIGDPPLIKKSSYSGKFGQEQNSKGSNSQEEQKQMMQGGGTFSSEIKSLMGKKIASKYQKGTEPVTKYQGVNLEQRHWENLNQ